jgi:hypothetical protein
MKKAFFSFLFFFFVSLSVFSIDDTLIVWKLPFSATAECGGVDFVFSNNDSLIFGYLPTSLKYDPHGIGIYHTGTGKVLTCYPQLPGSVPIFFDNDRYIALLRGKEDRQHSKYDRMIPIFETEKFIHGIEEPIGFIPIDSTTVPGVNLSNFFFDNLSFYADGGLPYYSVSPSGRYVIGMWSGIYDPYSDAWSLPHSYLIIDLQERRIVKRIPVDNSSPYDNRRRQEPLFLNDSQLVMVFKNVDRGEWEDDRFYRPMDEKLKGKPNPWVDSSQYFWYALVLYNFKSDTYDTLLFEKDYYVWYQKHNNPFVPDYWIWARAKAEIIFPFGSPQLFVGNTGRYILFGLINGHRNGEDINGWLLYDVVERRVKWKNTQLPFNPWEYSIKAYFSPDDKYIMANCDIIVDVETGKIIYELDRGHNWIGWLFNTLHSRPSHDWKYIVQLFLWSDDPDENSILLVRNPWYLATHNDINGVEVEGTLHPNPTNGMVIIPLDNFPIGAPTKIVLSSLQGATIKVLFDGILNEPIFMFDTAEIPSGVYFVTIQAENQFKPYKLIVVK